MIDEFEIMAGNPAFDAYFFSKPRALADRPEYRLGYVVSSRRPLKDLCVTHRAVVNFLERWLPWVERLVKLWNSLKGKNEIKEGKP